MAVQTFDLIIVGGGPGGYVAAIRAAQLGMKTALIEYQHLGGICLNWGCIPTKALLRSSELYHILTHAADYGLQVSGLSFDLGKIVDRSRKVAGQLSRGVAHLLKKNKVTILDGFGKLTGGGKLAVEKDGKAIAELTAPHIVLATGARARVLPGLEPDGKLVWTYREALMPDRFPKRLLVVGSGAIGIEFASFFASLGSAVTVVEIADRILPVEDAEISALARKAFEKQGLQIFTNAKIQKLTPAQNSLEATIEAGGKTETFQYDRAIAAVGIVGNVENIGLENTKAKVEKAHIVIDEWCRTHEAGLYAIGDVAGPPWLAHKASHEGVLCVEHIAGKGHPHPLNVRNVPGCTYSNPQIASIGLTEEAARAAGREIKVGRFPYIGNGKAIALGEPEGLIKTIFDAKTGELLGAHMIGAEVTELIQGYAVAKTAEATEAELMQTIFPHPTLSETMHEAVLAAYGRAIHF